MKITKRVSDINGPELRFAKQLGVDHIIGYMPAGICKPYWEFLDLLQIRKYVESFGLELAAVGSPPQNIMREIVNGGEHRDQKINELSECRRDVGPFYVSSGTYSTCGGRS